MKKRMLAMMLSVMMTVSAIPQGIGEFIHGADLMPEETTSEAVVEDATEETATEIPPAAGSDSKRSLARCR